MTHAISDSDVDGFPAVVLHAPDAAVDAAFAPDVGMVGCSLRHRGEQLLGQRRGLRAYAATGSSMGIPLLHPWANRLAGLEYEAAGRVVRLDPARSPLRLDANGLPIHGVLTASDRWQVAERGADEEGAWLVARLDFGAHPDYLAAFPFPHELQVGARLRGPVLAVTTTLRATGDVPVPVAFGWHPYLRLPGVPREDYQIDLPVLAQAVLDERGIPTGSRMEPEFRRGRLGDRALDDLFPALAEPPRFTLQGAGRRLSVELGDGYRVAQVFAPPGEDYICFEPMTAATNALAAGNADLTLVPPGGRYEATFTVSVAEL